MSFAFLDGAWTIANRRLNDGTWQEFAATAQVETHVDGRVQIDHFDAPDFPGRGHVRAVTIRALDPATGEWSIVWLSNYAPPDLRPVVGKWDRDAGEFFQTIETEDDRPLDVRFRWRRIDDDHARWEQAFSTDGGVKWETNWTMELTRSGPPA